MPTRFASPKSLITVLGAALIALLSICSVAGAAGVVNGDFETGNLAGWETRNEEPPSEEPTETSGGSWYAYSGSTSPQPPPPGDPGPEAPPAVPPPPVGTFAALSAQNGPGAHFLFQDVKLEAYWTHKLSMLIYYASDAPLFTPTPNALTLRPTELMMLDEGEEEPPDERNQQYRVDVMKPTAPLNSVAPGDILGVVFATKAGDPESMAATPYSFDLTPFAGQTVRLRLAEIDERSFLFAGADSIKIESTPPNNVFKLGKRKPNKKKGSLKLAVDVPGAGVLSAAKKKFIKPAEATAAAAGKVKLNLIPTARALATLQAKGHARQKVAFTFTPTGGTTAIQKVKVTLKLG